MISWSAWAHLLARPIIDGVERFGYPFDLSWTGPYWIGARSLAHVSPWLAYPMALLLLGGVYLAAAILWDRMGRAQEATRSRSGTHAVPSTHDSA